MKLSQREQLNGVSLVSDLIHVVRDGESWKRPVGELLKSSYIPWRYTSENWEVILFKFDKTVVNYATPQENDLVLCIDRTAKRMILALCLGAFSATTANLEDSAKFMRFIDTTALL